MPKAISIFTHSAGAVLLALASALLLINLTSPTDYVPPHDPIFLLSIRDLFWIIGGIVLGMALVCLFSERPILRASLLAWLAVNFLAYRIALFWYGCRSLSGFLIGFPHAFGISGNVAAVGGDVFFTSLLVGSCAVLWLGRRLPQPAKHQKMSCPTCGIHIRFNEFNLGQRIPCPQCRKPVTLRKPENLKMSCFFCQEHIEFPAHAIGEKIPCPHCNMHIILMEPADL